MLLNQATSKSGTAPKGYVNLANKLINSKFNPSTTHTVQVKMDCSISISGTTGLPKAVIFKHSRWTLLMVLTDIS
jgi:citronellyl-CoA synthetase